MMWELPEKGQLSEAVELPESSNLSRALRAQCSKFPLVLVPAGVGVGRVELKGMFWCESLKDHSIVIHLLHGFKNRIPECLCWKGP